MNIARQLRLSEEQLWELYYTLLLKDLGCSSNAARICELYATDDLRFKREFKWVDGSLPQVVRFILRRTGESGGLAERLKSLFGILSNGNEIARELIQTRCTRGADIARQLRFNDAIADAIHSLDEHWDGGGLPEGLAGERIPLYSRIALLSQVIDVFKLGLRPAGSRGRGALAAWRMVRPGTGGCLPRRSQGPRVLAYPGVGRA